MTEQLQLAKTRNQRKLWEKLRPVNIPASSDTYKRTMSGSSDLFANEFAAYNLAARKPLDEEGANGRLIIAGLEKTLYPWFLDRVEADEVKEAEDFFTTKGAVTKFPSQLWQKVLYNEGKIPVDIYGLPGGQTILAKDGKHVPHMSVEGPGGLVSHLEPHLENSHEPIIHATKAKLFEDAAGTAIAEFGMRSDTTINNHATMALALYVGGGIKLTSDDQARLIFPEVATDIGTVGHEFLMAYQREGNSLEDAQREAFTAFVDQNQRSALLPDVIHTTKSGLPAILEQIKRVQGTDKVVIPRFDSGDVISQCIYWKEMADLNSVENTQMVVEDGYNPTKARATKAAYAAAGYDPNDIIVGAGGYFFDEKNSRDSISLAYKRSATLREGNLEKSIKFSDSPGKESLPGQLRIYEQGNKLIVAQAEEEIEGKLLSQKLVENGRVIYNEDIETQRQRAIETWNKYDTIEYSPMTTAILEQRRMEKDAILVR